MKDAAASPSALPRISPAASMPSHWSRPRWRHWAGKAAAADPTWPRAAGRMDRRRRTRSKRSEVRWRRSQPELVELVDVSVGVADVDSIFADGDDTARRTAVGHRCQPLLDG